MHIFSNNQLLLFCVFQAYLLFLYLTFLQLSFLIWNFYFYMCKKFCDHSEHFCDHLEEKFIFRDKCGNFTSNRYRFTQTDIEILGLNPLQNSLLTILSILEKILLWNWFCWKLMRDPFFDFVYESFTRDVDKWSYIDQ